MPTTPTILDIVKKAVRVAASTTTFDDELADLISAAKNDLITGGVDLIDDTEPLIRQAIKYYCRANFRFGDSKEQELNDKNYQRLKAQLSSCSTIYGVPVDDDDSGGGGGSP